MKSMLIGIAGGSCSGKTTLAEKIKKCFAGQVQIIQQDNYYLDRTEIPLEERQYLNYDHPDALETELLITHLHRLKSGRQIYCPVYDFTVHNRKAEKRLVRPYPLILVDGILLYENEKLRNCFDYKIFVEADSEIRLKRRILRDERTRGRQRADIIRQCRETVEPMYEKYVEPYKMYADMIVTNFDEEKVMRQMMRFLHDKN